jgi:hypothetical protein
MEYTIYKIEIAEKPDLFYIGSTRNLCSRKHSHRDCLYHEKKKHRLLYKTILDNGGWDNIIVTELEKYITDNPRLKEQEYINNLKPTLNTIKAYRSQEEINAYVKEKNDAYRKIHKEEMNETCRKWKQDNKDRVKNYNLMYYETNKEQRQLADKKKYLWKKETEIFRNILI